MISELLQLSRIDNSEGLQNTERIDVVDILESVCEDTEYLVQGRRKFEYDFVPVTAEVDLTLIMIAVRNLVSNAVKYSWDGSTIRVSDSCDEAWIYIVVSDDGIGISEEEQKKIFDYYYQVSGGRNTDGFGLGLTLALKIARKHGGDIRMQSEFGKGSTFTLILPKAPEE